MSENFRRNSAASSGSAESWLSSLMAASISWTARAERLRSLRTSGHRDMGAEGRIDPSFQRHCSQYPMDFDHLDDQVTQSRHASLPSARLSCRAGILIKRSSIQIVSPCLAPQVVNVAVSAGLAAEQYLQTVQPRRFTPTNRSFEATKRIPESCPPFTHNSGHLDRPGLGLSCRS